MLNTSICYRFFFPLYLDTCFVHLELKEAFFPDLEVSAEAGTVSISRLSRFFSAYRKDKRLFILKTAPWEKRQVVAIALGGPHGAALENLWLEGKMRHVSPQTCHRAVLKQNGELED